MSEQAAQPHSATPQKLLEPEADKPESAAEGAVESALEVEQSGARDSSNELVCETRDGADPQVKHAVDAHREDTVRDQAFDCASNLSGHGVDAPSEHDSKPVESAGEAADSLVLLEIVTPAGSIYHVREDDWRYAVGIGAINVDLCDPFGERLKSTTRQLRARDRLRLSSIREYGWTLVSAQSRNRDYAEEATTPIDGSQESRPLREQEPPTTPEHEGDEKPAPVSENDAKNVTRSGYGKGRRGL